MKCHSELPYPKLDEIQKNPSIARLILHSYAGDVSEDTAIHQYLFQSVVLKDKNLEVSRILAKIAEVEMRHLRYLAEMIKKLGVYPVYVDPVVDEQEFFTARYVSYDLDIGSMLESDIESERKAILQYQSLIHVIDMEIVQKALERIVVDERIHLEILEKLYSSFL